MSDVPLPQASAEEVSQLAARLSEAPSLSVPAGATISGVIEIRADLVPLTAPGDVIYVIARDPESQGPPLAVQRLTGNGYPIRFVLDTATPTMPGAAQGKPLQLLVKVDKDGDASTSSEDDLLGAAAEPVHPGDSDVKVVVEATLGEVAAAVEPQMGAGGAGTGGTPPVRGEAGSGAPVGPPPGAGAGTAAADTAPSADASGGTRISGTITLPEALRGRASPSDVVFVIARKPGAAGPPVAVARLQGDAFPMRFTLDDGDLMLGGPWPQEVEIEVRLDKDGDPMTRGPEDLAGRAPGAVGLGQTDVRIELGR